MGYAVSANDGGGDGDRHPQNVAELFNRLAPRFSQSRRSLRSQRRFYRANALIYARLARSLARIFLSQRREIIFRKRLREDNRS